MFRIDYHLGQVVRHRYITAQIGQSYPLSSKLPAQPPFATAHSLRQLYLPTYQFHSRMSGLQTSPSPLTCSGTSNAPKRLADYEPLAKICSSFVLDLFAPAPTLDCAHSPYDSLPYFIAVALSQSQLPDTNALAALTLLQRLKSQYPGRTLSSTPKRNEAERLFLSSYIAATKVLSDDRYRLQFWVQVGQNKFPVEELNQMEKEFFEDLKWDVRIDDATLAIYQLLVKRRKQVDGTRGLDWLKLRSGSTSSSGSEESTGASSWESGSTETSPASSYPSTPADPSISDPVIAAGILRMKESEQNLADIDKRIEELQNKFNSLASNAPCRSQERSQKARHGTRHSIKEKLFHVFH